MTFTLRVLGNSTPYPRPDAACSGYLIEAAGTVLVMELGHAVWPELLRHVDPNDVAAVWVSHLHPDHCADLFAAYQWAANTDGARRLTVIGPHGWASRLGAALPSDDGEDQLRRLFDVQEHPDAAYQLGELVLRTVPVRHSVPTGGLRLTHRDSSLAYSGDSGTCEALATLAHGADVFICEAGAVERGQPYHCAPEDAAQLAIGAGQLLLTHLAPTLPPAEASRRANNANVAYPGMVLSIG